MSRAFQSSRSVGSSNARSAGLEAGGGSQKSMSAWQKRAKRWSDSHRYDWPSAASNGISKQLLRPQLRLRDFVHSLLTLMLPLGEYLRLNFSCLIYNYILITN